MSVLDTTPGQAGSLAYLCQNSFAGRTETPVVVIDPSWGTRAGRKHVKVRFETGTIIPGRRRVEAGDELAVPCYALKERRK